MMFNMDLENFKMDPNITLDDMAAALGFAMSQMTQCIIDGDLHDVKDISAFNQEKAERVVLECHPTGKKYTAIDIAHILSNLYGMCKAEQIRRSNNE